MGRAIWSLKDQDGVEGGNGRIEAGIQSGSEELSGVTGLSPEEGGQVDDVVLRVKVDDEVVAGVDPAEDKGIRTGSAAQDVVPRAPGENGFLSSTSKVIVSVPSADDVSPIGGCGQSDRAQAGAEVPDDVVAPL